MNRSSRTLLVSGASRGIGLAICRRLMEEGHRVVGLARRFEGISDNPLFTPVRIDLADLDGLPARLHQIRNAHADIDGIVCNAGKGVFGSLEEFSSDRIRGLIDLNLTSQLLLVHAFLPAMKTRKSGDVIFMGSEAALSGGQKGVVYSATKFALRGAAQSLREECASSGVRVGIINPGMVDTGFFSELNFRPGPLPDNHLVADDVASAVLLMLNARRGSAVDEINLSPQKRVIDFKR